MKKISSTSATGYNQHCCLPCARATCRSSNADEGPLALSTGDEKVQGLFLCVPSSRGIVKQKCLDSAKNREWPNNKHQISLCFPHDTRSWVLTRRKEEKWASNHLCSTANNAASHKVLGTPLLAHNIYLRRRTRVASYAAKTWEISVVLEKRQTPSKWEEQQR